MSKKLQIALLAVSLMALMLAAIANAQEPRPTPTNVPEIVAEGDEVRGSIRGTLYRDLDNDGRCPETGEGALAGIPIRFVSDDGNTTLYLQSGGNGTYGLVAAGLGTWKVSADPSADQGVVTSQKTREAFLGENQQLVLGVDFCIGTARPSAPVVLPVSGAPASAKAAAPGLSWLWLAALAGFAFIFAGIALHVRERVSER